jgi:cytochrome c peroxidase
MLSGNQSIFGLAFLALVACSASPDETIEREAPRGTSLSRLTLAEHTDVCEDDPRVLLGLVSLEACVGSELFFREAFGGNGRTCASCHPAANNFTIDVPFIASLPASDPLFIAEQVPALAGLEKPLLMRNFGLILENVDNTSNPTVRFTMRSVPHCFSLGTSITPQGTPTDGTTKPPNERTGWSGDGAPTPGELRDFQTGAVIQHYTQSLNRTAGTDFVLPTSDELDRIRTFIGSIGRTNELVLANLALSDTDADSGRTTFIGSRCNFCHSNAGATVAGTTNRNFATRVERLRIADLNTQGIPFDGGFGGGDQAFPNFDADGDTVNDSFGNGGFNTPPLIEAADTAPFFHTNAFATLEDAIGFYNTSTFNTSPAGAAGAPIAFTSTQIANVGRFLRVLNAAFNIQIAIKRANGVFSIADARHNQFKELQQELAALALAEVDDATEVLSAVSNLNATAQTSLATAHAQLVIASTHSSHTQRKSASQAALTALASANDSLSSSSAGITALSFTMGEGTLLF